VLIWGRSKYSVIIIASLAIAALVFVLRKEELFYKQAIELARHGDYAEATWRLQFLAEKYPQNRRYAEDYLLTLAWAGQDDKVLAFAERVKSDEMPIYLLEAVAKAARNQGDSAKAARYYELALRKNPADVTAKLGLAWLRLDAQQVKPAIAALSLLDSEYPDNAEVKSALAEAYDLDSNYQQAAEYYRQILHLQAGNIEAKLGLIMMLAESGESEQALELAKMDRALLNDDQWAHLNWDVAAILIRQGEEALELDPSNYAKLDSGISQIETNLAALPELKLTNPHIWRLRADADMLAALRYRQRFPEVLALYQQLQSSEKLPGYALLAVADAYALSGQSEPAAAMYWDLSTKNPDDFKARFSLLNFYLEQRQLAAAEQLLAEFRALQEKHPEQQRYRYEFIQALSLSEHNAEVLQLAGGIDEQTAPLQVLEAIAKAARYQRDFPLAERFYRLAAAKAPERLAPRLGLGLLLIDQQLAKPAVQYLQDLAAQHPDNPDVKIALAYAFELDGRIQAAAGAYREVLALQPNNAEALRGLIKAMAANGQTTAALTMAEQYRSALTDEQWLNLNWDYAATLLNQGRQTLARSPGDFRGVDASIRALQNNLAILKALNPPNSGTWELRARADMLVALHDRQRYQDAITVYQLRWQRGFDWPVYAGLAAADSYRRVRQPEQAFAIYRELRNQAPDDFGVIMALARAYLESGQTNAIIELLPKLQAIAASHPQQKNEFYDYLQVLAWTGQDAELLRQAAGIEGENAPAPVLDSIAKAARNGGEYELAEKLYRLSLAKAPRRLDPKLGLALLLQDRQQTKQAIASLQSLALAYPKAENVELALAYSYEQDHQYLAASRTYRALLALNPGNRTARHGLVFALAAAKEYQQALFEANAAREYLTDTEWAALRWDFAADLIRQGGEVLAVKPRDYALTDQGIAEIQANLQELPQLSLADPADWRRRASADLLVAYSDRKRYADVLSSYQEFSRQGVTLPVYGRMAAADAYLQTRQPAQARDLYLSVLQERPDNYNAKAALVYAYLDAEQTGPALQLAEQLAAEQPTEIESGQAGAMVENPRKISAALLAAMLHAYTDDLTTAQERLEQLSRLYPQNTDVQQKLAEIYYFRGWPRKARRLIVESQLQTPDHFGLQLTQAKVLHELRSYPDEETITRQVNNNYPDDSGAKKQARQWRKYNGAEFIMYAGGGVSTNTPTGPNPFTGSDYVSLDGFLYSNPIDYNFRAFTHDGWKTGLFKEGRGYLRHYGAGLEYSKNAVLANFEVYYDDFSINTAGANLALDYQLNDYWQIFTRLGYHDDTISLRALHSGVTADSARIGGTYRVSESRQLTLAAGYLNFSDGNNRYLLDSTYFERLYSSYLYKLNAYLNLGASANSSQNGAYFSPAKDANALLTLENDLLSYRNYETNFHQRLAGAIGSYWQENFGDNMIGNVQYEHRWQFGDNISLNYGGGRAYRYYDGALTKSWQANLMADIRF
jgi:biofilm PGA synthesis protein PgaA